MFGLVTAKKGNSGPKNIFLIWSNYCERREPPERHEGHVANSSASWRLHLGVEGARHGVSGRPRGGVELTKRPGEGCCRSWRQPTGCVSSLSSRAARQRIVTDSEISCWEHTQVRSHKWHYVTLCNIIYLVQFAWQYYPNVWFLIKAEHLFLLNYAFENNFQPDVLNLATYWTYQTGWLAIYCHQGQDKHLLQQISSS